MAALFLDSLIYQRMRYILGGLILISLVASIRAIADDIQPYATLQSISYSQPIAISAMLDQWDAPFHGGDKALTYNKAELGVSGHGWQLGVFTRYDYLMTFSDQTAQLYYLTKNHLPLETGKQYSLRIEARSQFSRGLRLGFHRQLTASLQAGAAISYLQGISLTDGGIHGTALVTADKDYDFQFDANYVYSRDVLFSRDVQAPHGNGYSLDIKLDWQANERLAGQLTVVDLLGKIFWDNAPYTIATATSATKTYDADGYVRYDPVISGFESNRDFAQTLPRKIFAAAQYQWNAQAELLAELQDLDIARFTSVGAGWRLPGARQLQGLYNITARALTLRYQQPQLRFEISSDKLNVHQARYFAFTLSYRQFF